MNQAFYAVQERDKDICFASDQGRIWSYQKDSGEFTLIELPTKGQITSIHPVAPDVSVITTDSDGFFTYNLRTKTNVHYSFLTCKALPAKTNPFCLCRPFFGSVVRAGRTGCCSPF